jgi:predicted ATP-grasp superfamily ATP-dependent carboligase
MTLAARKLRREAVRDADDISENDTGIASPIPVLVTDGEQRAALALVRSLGRAGYLPFVCSTRGSSLAGASRYAAGEAPVPDPLTEPSGFAIAVESLVRRWDIRVLLPVAEPAMLAILDAPEHFPGTVIPFADAESFRRICDKESLLNAAETLGIAVPAQHTLRSQADAQQLDPQSLQYPLVVKPARSVAGGETERVKLGVCHASSPAELRARLEALPGSAYPVMLQQRIVGPGVGIFLLRWDGKTLAEFAHRRLREKPPSGGVSVYRESIPVDRELARRSTELLDRFDWRGVAMIEYKIDSSTGTPYLMEVNGRFWGSLQLAIDSGVDFPTLLVRASRGEQVVPATRYRIGIRSRWWWGDVDQLLSRLRRSRSELSLPPDAPPLWRSLLDFLILWRPDDRNEIFDWSDPRPLLRESVDWFARR